MIKAGAVSILTTVFSGLLAWGAVQIVEVKSDISSAKVRIENLRDQDKQQLELLQEVRQDIKILLQGRR